MKESTRIYGQGDFPSPLKIYGLTICVHQVWLNKQEKIPWYTAVNVYLKEISRDTLYPVFAEECYKKLIELLEQEGLTVLKE